MLAKGSSSEIAKFVIQKAAPPKSRVELYKKSIGAIRYIVYSYIIIRRHATSHEVTQFFLFTQCNIQMYKTICWIVSAQQKY